MNVSRIAYIVNLRGLSALLVLIYHHCHFFWMNQRFCGKLANNPPTDQVPGIATFLESLPINLGDLGVATFFLISGFLMPLAAQNKTRQSFIKSRIRRIWPPYVISLLLLLFFVYLNSKNNLRSFPWEADHILASIFLIRNIGGYPFIDGIVWTLEIEVQFYLLCYLVLPWLLKKPLQFISLIIFLSVGSFCLMTFKSLIDWPIVERLIKLFFKSMKFLCFMAVGSVLSYIFQGKIQKGWAIVLGMILLLLYSGHLFWEGIADDVLIELISYLCALGLFILCYLYKEKMKAEGIMGYVGVRSYSLYLVHGVLGYIVMYRVIHWTNSATVSIVAALLVSFLSAFLFYKNVEKN